MPLHDRAGELVAHDQWRLGARMEALVDVHVGATDADIGNFDQGLVVGDFRYRLVGNDDFLRIVVDDAFHLIVRMIRSC